MKYINQISAARQNIVTDEMKACALAEGVAPEKICEDVMNGFTVITKNRLRDIKPLAVGKDLKTKVNANIGSSGDNHDIEEELEKLNAAIKSGADAVMDLSTGGNIVEFRLYILKNSSVPIGTVPLYEAFQPAVEKGIVNPNSPDFIDKFDPEYLFDVIERQCEEGVDFITVHCGLTLKAISTMNMQTRIMGIVSRGGSLIASWMIRNNKENPLYENYERLLKIAKKNDVVLSLGDGLRPGCLHDATDRAQITELITLGELQKKALEEGVQVMIEGPGHVPLNQVEENIKLEKSLCNGAPFYVLGPLVTDIAPGYDHITSAIGGAIAAGAGADFLCYVTPAEHLRLPSVSDVKEGVIAAKIAAHAGDIAKGIKGAANFDLEMSKNRRAMNWEKQYECALDPERAREMRASLPLKDDKVCSMCSSYCSIKLNSSFIK
ncbi:MAG: phosphomethylpyrimidine synthase ThiC [Candidatus Acidulodesulfobacterium acidiphilum]|uniref:Phosphomethylpyrimidine synthase n=1 Tax=Candidatus Acidulodesulfobacterium acidiphilum TaxID=2597224 RepID=A0A520XBL9_9DELT|nr:MAG: phosphomethylpyrimidine synthase ThiC [Candidatus Acidulodesulfobacterium acidiphilum]